MKPSVKTSYMENHYNCVETQASLQEKENKHRSTVALLSAIRALNDSLQKLNSEFEFSRVLQKSINFFIPNFCINYLSSVFNKPIFSLVSYKDT